MQNSFLCDDTTPHLLRLVSSTGSRHKLLNQEWPGQWDQALKYSQFNAEMVMTVDIHNVQCMSCLKWCLQTSQRLLRTRLARLPASLTSMLSRIGRIFLL